MTNFGRTLPPPESDLAQRIVKDPYQFDFLTVAEDAKERDLERALLTRVKDVLLEMGEGQRNARVVSSRLESRGFPRRSG